jgi:hypothetical protein
VAVAPRAGGGWRTELAGRQVEQHGDDEERSWECGVKDEQEVEDERRSHARPNPWEACFFVPHRTLFEIRMALDGKENVKASSRTL